MSNFAFLQAELSTLHGAAAKAEALAHPDPRTACFYARRALELAAGWMYRYDRTLAVPYQENLSALIHEPSFRRLVGPAVFAKTKQLKDLGNQAVHTTRPIWQLDALMAVRELFHVCFLVRPHLRARRQAGGRTGLRPGGATGGFAHPAADNGRRHEINDLAPPKWFGRLAGRGDGQPFCKFF